MRIIVLATTLAFALGKTGVLPSTAEALMWAAAHAHQKGPMSYSKFNRMLWSGGKAKSH